MKFVFSLILLVSVLVATTSQQFYQQRTGPQWLSQYHQSPLNFQYNHRQPAASLYYQPVDANMPFFRYSRPNVQQAVIHPHDEKEHQQGTFEDHPHYYIDNKQTVANMKQKNQDSLVLKQMGQDNEEKDSFTVFPYVRPMAPTAVYSQADNDESIVELIASQNFFVDRPSKIDLHPKLSPQNERVKLGNIIPVVAEQAMINPNQMANTKPRMKNYGLYQNLGNEQQNARVFYLDGSNFLSRTITLTVTSTCTSVNFVSCIQLADLDPNAPPVPCRRKRSLLFNGTSADEVDSQFLIKPSSVETVTPTVAPSSVLPHDPIQTPLVEMISSKEEAVDADESNSLATYEEKMQREGKALKFNLKNFLTYTTVTILGSVVTNTLTQTLVPVEPLACLPPAYVICPL